MMLFVQNALDNLLGQVSIAQAELVANAVQLVASVTGVLNNITGPVLDNFVNVVSPNLYYIN